jgi:hypothetical protein
MDCVVFSPRKMTGLRDDKLKEGILDILTKIEDVLRPGHVIPKPQATSDFVVKGWGTRRNDRALVYTIPNHKTPARPYEKGVTISEWRQAFEQLTKTGSFSRRWFEAEMAACAKEGGCNFTTIGGVFEALGYATYERGVYVTPATAGKA